MRLPRDDRDREWEFERSAGGSCEELKWKGTYLLTTPDFPAFDQPRICKILSQKTFETRDDLFLVSCSPPWTADVAHETGMGDYLVLAVRLEGYALQDASTKEVPVYVLLPLKRAVLSEPVLSQDAVLHYVWGQLGPFRD